MPGRTFLDTNVILYQFDKRDPEKQARSLEILREAALHDNCSISYQVVQEFIAVATKKEAIELDPLKVEEYLMLFLKPLWKVWPSEELYALAIHLSIRHIIGFYDALIVGAAILGDCDILYTEDLQDGMVFDTVKVVNPFLHA